MSNCGRFEELISLSVSGELSGPEREELRAHLAGCEACRMVLARETRLWALIQQSRAAAPAVPGELSDRLAAGTRVGAAAGRPRRRWLLWAGAAAAALVAVALGLAALRARENTNAPVQVAEVRAGKLLVKESESWRETGTLLAGQVFKVPGEPGASVRLKLADGSRLELERGMTGWLGRGFAGRAAGRQVELFSGALTAEVAKARGDFKVSAPGGTVTATGTRFWVRSGPPEGKEEDIVGRQEIVSGTLAAALAVAVFEGSVLVQAAGAAEPVPVKAGNEAAAAAGAPLAVGERTVASAVPADALFFVGAAGRERWKKSFADSTLGAAYREEEVKRFLAPLFEKVDARLAELKRRAEENLQKLISFAEIEKALVGEVGLAVLDLKPKAGGGEDPVVLLVAEVGENAAAFEAGMDEFVKRVQAALAAAGAGAAGDLRARAYRGTDLRTFTVDKVTIAYARAKGYFLFAFDSASVEKGIDCLEGATASLAAAPMLKRSENGLVAASLNLAELIKRLRARNPENKDWKPLDALGFTAARQLSYRLDFDKPVFREKFSAEVAKTEGLLALLKEARPVDAAKLAADAPAEALFFAAANLPAEKALEAVLKAVESVEPKQADNARRELLGLKARGLDLEALLTKSLTGEAAVWVTMPPAGAGMIPEVVIVLRTRDNAAVEGLIQMLAREAAKGPARQRIAAEMGAGGAAVDWAKVNEQAAKAVEAFKLDPVDYKGGRLFALPQEKGNPVQVTAMLMPDRAIFASSALAAKRAALKPAAALADRAEFRDALSVLSPKAVAAVYADAPKLFSMVYGTAQPFLVGLPAERLKEQWGLDFKQLPPPELVAKHLAAEAGAVYADESGLRLEARTNLPRSVIFAALAGAVARTKQEAAGFPAVRTGGKKPQPEKEEF